MKILLAGTPDFAATSLAVLLNSHHTVQAIYTQPDRKAGRGQKLQASAVKALALAHQLPVCQLLRQAKGIYQGIFKPILCL